MGLDPNTPVLVGVGQFTEHVDREEFQGMSAVELGTHAARAALSDVGIDEAAALASIDVTIGLRQFENSAPIPAPLGSSNNYPRSIMQRLGAQPRHAVLAPVGGHGPQKLVTEFGARIAAGACGAVLIVGSEAGATLRHFAKRDSKPDFSEHVAGQLEDRGYGIDEYTDEYIIRHGLISAPTYYGLMDNARRAEVGRSVEQYRQDMALLFAPMSDVAAANPYAAFPITRSVSELCTVTDENRMFCLPYSRLLVAREDVNQGGAVVMMSVAEAQRLGVSEDKWIFLHGHADMIEQPLLSRQELGRSPATVCAVREALDVADISVDDVTAFDLYSCFPFPVFTVCDEFGIRADDARGLTRTGGLPYFGGPGNSYSLHAIAEIVTAMRSTSGGFGLVGANGGMMSYYSVGVYSAQPCPWRGDRSAELSASIAAQPRVRVAVGAEGPATVETYTALYRRGAPPQGIVVAQLAGGAGRVLARVSNETLLARLTESDPLGAQILVRTGDSGNTAVLA